MVVLVEFVCIKKKRKQDRSGSDLLGGKKKRVPLWFFWDSLLPLKKETL